jgi:hypothetical protein
MFERICINRQDPFGVPIDLGFLAEALVFYQRVHLVSDSEMFKSVIRICGHEPIIEMMEMGVLTIDYVENMPVVLEHNRFTPYKVYDIGFIQAEQLKFQSLAPKFLQELTGKSGKGRRVANRLSKLVNKVQCDPSLPMLAKADAFNESYLVDLARALLQYFAPAYQIPEPCVFRLHEDNQGWRLETNIDFEKANGFFRLRADVSDATLTPAYLLSHVVATRKDLGYAAEFSTDLAVSTPTAIAAGCKFRNLVARRAGRDAGIKAFEDLIFSESRCIREAVNSGERNFDDVLRLVNAGMKFKEWLRKSSQDADLVKEYCREVTRAEWADKLPPKTARWAVFAAAGAAAGFLFSPLAGTAVGIGLSAGDSFLLDKLIKGWKPNQFVNGPLKEFVKR